MVLSSLNSLEMIFKLIRMNFLFLGDRKRARTLTGLSCSTYKQDCNATRDECWKRQLGNWVRRRHWHRTLQLYSYWILKRKPFSSVALTSPEQMWQCLQANSGQQSGHWENIKKKETFWNYGRQESAWFFFFLCKNRQMQLDLEGQTLGIKNQPSVEPQDFQWVTREHHFEQTFGVIMRWHKSNN